MTMRLNHGVDAFELISAQKFRIAAPVKPQMVAMVDERKAKACYRDRVGSEAPVMQTDRGIVELLRHRNESDAGGIEQYVEHTDQTLTLQVLGQPSEQ
jgi:hypothetical protein